MYHLNVFKSDKHQKNCGGNPCFNFDLQFIYTQQETYWERKLKKKKTKKTNKQTNKKKTYI
jgi:hypothetical protein